MFHTFALYCLCCCHLVGVFGVDVKSVSVKEGDSVTLQINVTEIQADDEIEWKFGTDRNLIAETSGKTSKILDVPDGRFRDRLKLDNQTGSLIITNTRTTDSGLYEVTISSSSSVTKHRFTVTVNGVFGVDVKSVSVKEGDSVTLQINAAEIQADDEIEWKFGTDRNLIAETNGKTSKILDVPDGRFRDRLKLDNQTGSLIITNTRTTDSGLYEVTISSTSSVTKHRFTVTVNGVFGVDVKSVSVKEGDSVTLQINAAEIQADDEIEWKFGTDRNLIAETNGKTSKILDVRDGRFRDRLKLDNQTGSLTITNTRTTDSGLYEVTISSTSSVTKHRFNVTVNDCTFCCHVPESVTRLVISILLGMAAAFIVVYDITSKKVEQERTEQTSSSSSDPHR